MPFLGSAFAKLVQRRAYDLLSLKYGFIGLLVAAALLVTSALLFGEAALEWSGDKYAAIFNSFSDNIIGKSFQTRLCSPVPIDVVYTWVNGSDPQLLAELRLVKAAMEVELSAMVSPNASTTKCTYAHCIRANCLVIPGQRLSSIVTLKELQLACEDCAAVSKLDSVKTDDSLSNVTLLHHDYSANISSTAVTINNVTYSFVQGYYTSDLTLPNSVLMHDTVLISGLKQSYSSEVLQKQMPEEARILLREVRVFDTESVAVVFTHTAQDATALLSMASNITLGGRQLTMSRANLVYSLSYVKKPEDISASRYEDNEELRFSLRSLEKHAPWVRHVYIVTNGQIPYWLNLENPRVTVITHEDIFTNKSHLPTFSSPAIESHLHRIPGLSEKFIYMNDDVMFGQSVWPDDFYTHSKGQKVHLTWAIPDCAPGCPQSWIKDGYCDKTCNNSACQFDGGDCAGGRPAFGHGAGNPVNGNNWHGNWIQNSAALCHTGCSNHWIADKYCDQTCNVKECGYDAGDCGVSNFHNLPMYTLMPGQTQYQVPLGDSVSYFNTSVIFQKIEEAHFIEDKLLRVSAISNKYKVMTMILHANQNASVLSFNLTGKSATSEQTVSYAFLVAVEPRAAVQTRAGNVNSTNGSISVMQESQTTEPAFHFDDVPENERNPVAAQHPFMIDDEILDSLNSTLPPAFDARVKDIEKMLEDGLLTLKGYKRRRRMLLYKAVHGQADDDRPPATAVRTTATAIGLQDPDRSYGNADGGRDKSTSVEGHGAQRKLLSYAARTYDVHDGFLPWERVGTFDRLTKARDAMESRLAAMAEYVSAGPLSLGARRRLLALDTFAESLHFVNRLYNAAFGYSTRKVIGHIAHMIDKPVMVDLQHRFPAEWDATSSHRVRSGTDMQFAFSYFHFLMNAKLNNTVEDFIDQLDTDNSGVLSDRELRTLATRVFDAPLDLQSLMALEEHIVNCSKLEQEGQTDGNGSAAASVRPASTSISLRTESYYESAMPQVTKELLLGCQYVTDLVSKKIKPAPKYKFETVGDDELTFKMIGTNLTTVVGQLDDIRRNTRKFICLNDNIDHHHPDASNIKALLQDFYESLFPLPSQFELPPDFRNRYLRMDELRNWKSQRGGARTMAVVVLAFVVMYTLLSFCATRLRRSCRSHRRSSEGRDSEELGHSGNRASLLPSV